MSKITDSIIEKMSTAPSDSTTADAESRETLNVIEITHVIKTCVAGAQPVRSLDESTVTGVTEYDADNNGISDACVILAHRSVLMDYIVQPSD